MFSLLSVPRLAIECSLAMVRPGITACDGAKWSEEATKYVRGKLQGKDALAKVFRAVNFDDDNVNKSNQL